MKAAKAPGLLTKSAYARRIEVSPQYVSKLIKQGKLVPEEDGRLDPVKADAQIKALRHPERDQFRTSMVPEADAEGQPQEYGNYQKARTIQAAYKARLTQLEYEMLSGEVVKKAEVKTALFVAARTTRDSILAIPKRISALLAGESDRHKIEKLLRGELQQALTTLSEDEIPSLFRGQNK